MALLAQCINGKDSRCAGFDSGGWVEARDTVLVTRDGVGGFVCMDCFIALTDPVSEAEQVVAAS